LPHEIDEGRFGYFSREALNALSLPETDRIALWPIYDKYRDHFVSLRADCRPDRPLHVEIEEVTPPDALLGSSAGIRPGFST
jgi:8-oxo-dGTP diphosphatase